MVKSSQDDEDDFMVATEWDDVLTNASESEIVELAGRWTFVSFHSLPAVVHRLAILGFTGLINQVQYHAALTEKGLPSVAGGWNGNARLARIRKTRSFALVHSSGREE